MKKFIVWMIILLCFGDVVCAEEDENLQLYAQSAILMDGESGRILYEKDGYNPMANASTTKVLTCILALEYGDLDSTIVASKIAASQPAVHLGVHKGEEYRLNDLLYALMLESYNDSAVMIAESISGSVENFAILMNHKANEIGCTDSYFITPNGLDAEDHVDFHHTTASDLAKIMKYCIMVSPKKEEFINITQTLSYSFQDIGGTREYSCMNRNALLKSDPDAISGKTGFTNDAGYCYVGAIESEGRTFISVVLACGWPYNKDYKWEDTATIFDYARENYQYSSFDAEEYINELEDGILDQIMIKGGKTEDEAAYLDVNVESSGAVQLLMSDEERVRIKLDYPEILYAPIEKDMVVGSVGYYLDDMLVKIDSITVNYAIEKADWRWRFYKKIIKIN